MISSVTRTRDDEWRWLWNEVRPFARYQAGALALMLLGVSIHALNPLLMKTLIDDVLPQRRVGMLVGVALLVLAVYVGSNILSGAGRMINHLGILRLVYRVRMRLVHHVLALPAAFHLEHPIGDLIRRIEDDVTLVGELGSDLLPTIIRAVVQGVVMIAAMAVLDWRLTLVVMPLVPLYAYVRRRYRDPLRQSAQHAREASGRQTSLLNELLTGAMQIQALGAERRLCRRYARLNLKTMRARWGQQRTEVLFTLTNMSVVALGFSLIMLYGGVRVIDGSLSSGGLVAFYSYVGFLFGPLMIATEAYARLGRVRSSITRLIEIERHALVCDAPGAIGLPTRPQSVACTNVTFGYLPGRTALAGLDFVARAGERIVLIGPSGCGKSSLLKLIPRFYDVSHGRVTIDGRDVRDLEMRSLRSAISFVPQDPVLFQGTLRDNLRHGSPGARADDIERALWMTCLTDVVARLPKGLETELGRVGSALSGGERQRLVMARAILQDRPILILDEATSALDPSTEHRLLERLQPWCRDRVVIMVSHRASAPLWADRVVTFHKGRIVSDDARLVSFPVQ